MRILLVYLFGFFLNSDAVSQDTPESLLDRLRGKYRNINCASYDATVAHKPLYKQDTVYANGSVVIYSGGSWRISNTTLYNFWHRNDSTLTLKGDSITFSQKDTTEGALGNIYDRLLIFRTLHAILFEEDPERILTALHQDNQFQLVCDYLMSDDTQVAFFRSTYFFNASTLDLIRYSNDAKMMGDGEQQYVHVSISNLTLNKDCR